MTQADVVAATNKFTSFTAGGISTVTDWTIGPHHGTPSPACTRLGPGRRGSTFVSVFAKGNQVFACVGPNAKNPVR